MASLSNIQREVILADLSPLRRFCLSLTGSQADADDLLQSTVERLLDKGMPADANATKWAYRVCKNLWIDELRSREVRQRDPGLADDHFDTAPSAEESATGQRQMLAVGEALEKLPHDQRLALTLVAVEGKTYAEAAEILEVPMGTIMSRISRARKQLAETIEDWRE